jgi:hypothetical protein
MADGGGTRGHYTRAAGILSPEMKILFQVVLLEKGQFWGAGGASGCRAAAKKTKGQTENREETGKLATTGGRFTSL